MTLKQILNNQTVLRRSNFSHIFKKEDRVAVYHSLNQKVIYGDQTLGSLLEIFHQPVRLSSLSKFRAPKINRIIKKLLEAEILVPEAVNEGERISRIREEIEKKFGIDLLYLVLTDRCNYACKYCFIERELPMRHKFSTIDIQKTAKALNLFVKWLPRKTRHAKIILYGGEPLLCRQIILFVTEKVRELEKAGLDKPIKFDVELITNGALIDDNYAEFLHRKNIKVSVSIDGWRDIHNKKRVSVGNLGTFDETIRGFLLLKKQGFQPGISCTIGEHNIDELDKVLEYFAENLRPGAVGLNPPFRSSKTKQSLPPEYVAEKMIHAFLVAREYGLYEDRTMKLINPFVEEYIRLADCGAYGTQAVITPTGRVGVCPGFLGLQSFFPGDVSDNRFVPYKCDTFKEWNRRSPFNMPQCQNCFAISICGGGCAYSAYNMSGDIWALDRDRCVLSKTVLEWAIWDAFRNFESRELPISNSAV